MFLCISNLEKVGNSTMPANTCDMERVHALGFLRDKPTVYNRGKLNHSHTKRIRIRQTQVRWVDRSESDSEAPSPVLLQPGFDPNPGRELVPGELRLVSQSLESVTKRQPWIGNYEV